METHLLFPYSMPLGEAHRLDNGNTLVNYGDLPEIREVTPDGAVVWAAHFSEPVTALGRMVMVDDLSALTCVRCETLHDKP